MPIVKNKTPGFTDFTPQPLEEPLEAPNFGTTVQSAFRLNSDIKAVLDLVAEPEFAYNPDFKLMERINKEGLAAERDLYLGVFSDEEFDARRSQINKERQDRQNMVASGWPGVAAGITASVLSPTMFLPLTTGAKGVKAVASGAGLGLFGIGGQEMVLQAAQQTRTAEETGWTLATGAVLGAILGGAAGHFRPGETVATVAKRMDDTPGGQYISHPYGSDAKSSGLTAPERNPTDEAAAIIFRGEVYTGDRHQAVMDQILEDLGTTDELRETLEAELGELDIKDFGKFVDGKFRSQDFDADKYYNSGRAKVAPKTSLSDLADNDYEIGGGTIPERGLVPANAYASGKVYIGKPQDLHFSVSERYPDAGEPTFIGFANPEGQLLNRAEALAWVTKHETTIKSNLDEGLDAADYREQVTFGAQSAGAAAVTVPHAGGLKPAIPGFGWANKLLSGIGPVTRGLQQDTFKVAQWMTAQFGTGGLRLEGNIKGIPSAVGGTIEHLKQLWMKGVAESLEEHERLYRNYFFDGKPPRFFANTRAEVGGLTTRGKLSRKEFNEAVGNAMFVNGEHAIPEVAASAKLWQEKLYKPLSDEAVALKVYEMPESMVDAGYLNRLYDNDKILARMGDFVDIIAEHIARKTTAKYDEELGKLLEKEAGRKQKAADIELAPDKAAELRESLRAELKALEDGAPEDVLEAEETIKGLRESAKDLKGAKSKVVDGKVVTPKSRAEELEAARKLEELYGDSLGKIKERRGEIKRRLRNLNKNRHVIGDKLAGKLARIERLEELQLKSLDRVIRKAEKVAADLDKYSHETLVAKAEELKGQFEALGRTFDKGDEKLRELGEGFEESELRSRKTEFLDTPMDVNALQREEQRYDFNFWQWFPNRDFSNTPTPRELARIVKEKTGKDIIDQKFLDEPTGEESLVQQGLRLEATQESRAARMDRLAERLDDVESLDDEGLRSWIADALEETKKTVNDLNSKRAVRSAKLTAAAKELGPESIEAELAKIAAKSQEARLDFNAKYSALGDFDIEAGTRDFAANAKEVAQDVAHKILGTHSRIQGMHLLLEERGPEIARTLDIPSTFISAKGSRFADFLVTDIERAARSYNHTLSADIEITRKFGDANAKIWFKKLQEEYDAQVDVLTAEGKTTDKLSKEFLAANYDLKVLLERAKAERGIPKDPSAFLPRAGRVMLAMNGMRLLGTTLISSVADAAQPVMKYGLGRAYRDAWAPWIGRTKQMNIAKREAKLASIGNDTLLHTRMLAIADIAEEFASRSKFERGVEYASSKMGQIALFDQWTDFGKQMATSIAMVKISDSLGIVAGGVKASAKETDEAVEFLASAGMDKEMAETIWAHMNEPGGGDVVNGVLLPNTEAWTGDTAKDAIRWMRAAFKSQAEANIISPGFERPNWIDNTLPGKMVGQFKSFAFSSTTKTLMAGLQARDANFATGVTISLAMGAMSYYLWAVATGGKAYDDMLEAGPDRWSDEAIARSGVLGALGLIQNAATKIPAISDFATFAGKGTTNRAGDSLIEALAGPSFDLMNDAKTVLLGLDSPTQGTLHALRSMLPFQNLWYLRQAFDAVEQSSGLPEKREPRQ